MHHETPSWRADADLVAAQTPLVGLLAAVDGRVALLDVRRQIVWASPVLLAFLNQPSPARVLGAKPGEALGCVHAFESALGCGGVEACYFCGAVGAILESKRTGGATRRAGRLEVLGTGGPSTLELQVTAAPWSFGERHFTVLTLN